MVRTKDVSRSVKGRQVGALPFWLSELRNSMIRHRGKSQNCSFYVEGFNPCIRQWSEYNLEMAEKNWGSGVAILKWVIKQC